MNPVTPIGDCFLLIHSLKSKSEQCANSLLNYWCILDIHRFIDRTLADRKVYGATIWSIYSQRNLF